jgi:hypothetical protein
MRKITLYGIAVLLITAAAVGCHWYLDEHVVSVSPGELEGNNERVDPTNHEIGLKTESQTKQCLDLGMVIGI